MELASWQRCTAVHTPQPRRPPGLLCLLALTLMLPNNLTSCATFEVDDHFMRDIRAQICPKLLMLAVLQWPAGSTSVHMHVNTLADIIANSSEEAAESSARELFSSRALAPESKDRSHAWHMPHISNQGA
eukprot:scaffold196698_cov15-Tisochrysis_lutea.AAC.1